jgi:hypothetical protein
LDDGSRSRGSILARAGKLHQLDQLWTEVAEALADQIVVRARRRSPTEDEPVEVYLEDLPDCGEVSEARVPTAGYPAADLILMSTDPPGELDLGDVGA